VSTKSFHGNVSSRFWVLLCAQSGKIKFGDLATYMSKLFPSNFSLPKIIIISNLELKLQKKFHLFGKLSSYKKIIFPILNLFQTYPN
jgi:hypothetical protein